MSVRALPVLASTVVDVAPTFIGARGDCFHGECDCRFFIGTAGLCADCSHPNTFHSVRPTREAEAKRRDDEERLAKIFTKRQIRLQREADAAAARIAVERAANAKSPRLTAPPCTVAQCECLRFDPQPITTLSTNVAASPTASAFASAAAVATAVVSSETSDPRLCRRCRHADLYHLKSAATEGNANSSSGSNAKPKAKAVVKKGP